jgi:hypothetical protein
VPTRTNPWVTHDGGWVGIPGVMCDVTTGLPDGADPADYPLPPEPEYLRQMRETLRRELLKDTRPMVLPHTGFITFSGAL